MSCFNRLSLAFILCSLMYFPVKSQEIDKSMLTDHNIYLHSFDLIRIDAPMLKLSYENQILDSKYLGFELGYISDFNARVFRTDDDEKGIYGFHVASYYAKAIPVSSIDYTLFGIRVNYGFRNRHFESWILRSQNSYRQLMNYQQVNNELGINLKLATTRRYPNGISYSIGASPGLLFQFVKTDLPEDASVYGNPPAALRSSYRQRLEKGAHLKLNLFFEFNIGYSFR